MKTDIDDDVEVSLDPYLCVRFTYTCTPDEVKDLRWGVMVNEDRIPEREVNELVGAWLRKHDKSEEILLQAAEVFHDWAVDEKLASRKEGGP